MLGAFLQALEMGCTMKLTLRSNFPPGLRYELLEKASNNVVFLKRHLVWPSPATPVMAMALCIHSHHRQLSVARYAEFFFYVTPPKKVIPLDLRFGSE